MLKGEFMEALRVLEEKIVSLVGVVQELKAKNEALNVENKKALATCDELLAENSKLISENAHLAAKLEALESSVLSGNERLEETKVVVDDLIKSIDALVSSEHQR